MNCHDPQTSWTLRLSLTLAPKLLISFRSCLPFILQLLPNRYPPYYPPSPTRVPPGLSLHLLFPLCPLLGQPDMSMYFPSPCTAPRGHRTLIQRFLSSLYTYYSPPMAPVLTLGISSEVLVRPGCRTVHPPLHIT